MSASSATTTSLSSTRAVYAAAGFQPHIVPIPPSEEDPLLNDLEIYALRYQHASGAGAGASAAKEPLLLLHGHPQNLSIWHRIAPTLAQRAGRDIVLADLRGHGHSGVPRVRNIVRKGHADEDATTPNEDALRQRYSKRATGRDMLHVMRHLGYDKFAIVGHDRGGRVAHRMALDYPDTVTRIMTLDIVPTLDLYNNTNKVFAAAYWHWFFLIQPYPMPEDMLVHSPKSYLDRMVVRFSSQTPPGQEELFPADVLSGYLAALSSPTRVHAMCEDYRCSAPGGFDLTLDEQDRKAGRKVTQPLRALWGSRGLNPVLFGEEGCVKLWQDVCSNTATGKGYDCGHYMPEECPQEMIEEILSFFA